MSSQRDAAKRMWRWCGDDVEMVRRSRDGVRYRFGADDVPISTDGPWAVQDRSWEKGGIGCTL